MPKAKNYCDKTISHFNDDKKKDNGVATFNTSETEHENNTQIRNIEGNQSLTDAIRTKIIGRYQQRQGKQLYIRFPHKLPEDENELNEKVHAISSLIIKAHKPRQKHARFCLVDFNSKTDRDTAYNTIKQAIKEDPAFKGLVTKIPHTDNCEFVEQLVKKKLATLEKRKGKRKLKRASKTIEKNKLFTSTVVVSNIPQTASVSSLREVFPKAIDIQIKSRKGIVNSNNIAAITLPSTTEARIAVRKKCLLHGAELKIRYDKQAQLKKPKSRKSEKEFVQMGSSNQ